MTVKSNLDAAVVDLKTELDSMSFLDPGAKTAVDQDLIDAIQADMDALVASYSAEFEGELTDYPLNAFTPSAEQMAHWLFDGEGHTLTMSLYPTSESEALVFTSVVPFPWR
jgi:hypothetical protein